jgi:hypothetical protein
MDNIIPYIGCGDFLFDKNIDEIKAILKGKCLKYSIEHWPNKGCTPEVAWDIIRIDDKISMFFAKEKMFKIYFENGFEGVLPNGISLGQRLDEAVKTDQSLKYDEWNEEYVSEHGYWIEDDIETGRIISISIFIKALENDEYFYSYDWCNQ